MAFDLIVKNGTVVDGTGAPRFHADIGVTDGKIAEIGKINGSAKRTLDASDLIVSPGFVDPHTHYDAQICWDPLISCSSWHGVTSVVMGNCGVGLAPCRPEVQEVAAWDLVNVEGIPFEVLGKGVTWDWETYPEYLDAAARRGSGINLGFLAPLTPFRHYVMGEASMDRSANAEERTQIAALLREAVLAGALGISTTMIPNHIGYEGRPLACRQADRAELKAYANVLKQLGRGSMELALTAIEDRMSDEEYDLLDFLLTESGRPVTWLAILSLPEKPDAAAIQLRKAAPLIERGGVPQITCRPFVMQLELRSPFIMANYPSCAPIFNRPLEEQMRVYRDPGFRAALRKDMVDVPMAFSGKWERLVIQKVGDPALKGLEGRTVAEVAAERGADDLDTFLDVALEDELRTAYSIVLYNANDALVRDLVVDPRVMIGLSDGGAHVDMICDAGYATYMLGKWVREEQAVTLERAVERLTTEPARFFGIQDRGALQVGLAADLAIFDYETVGSAVNPESRDDLPGGGRRLVMPAQGVQYTVVNGEVLYAEGEHTGAMPGQVLRSA